METPECEGGTTEEVVKAFKESGAEVADLCSNAKTYAAQGLEVAKALKEAGAKLVYLSGCLLYTSDAADE